MARPEQIAAAIFDFDGTLADTEPLATELDIEAFNALGLTDIAMEDLYTIAGTDGVESIPALMRKYGRDDLTLEDFHAVRADHSVLYRTKPLSLMGGAGEFLADLRARGIKTALVSTTEARNIVYALNRLGITTCFDVIVAGDMVENRKPHPEPFNLALGFLGVDAADAVVFEDSPTGIAAAKAAGLYVVGFTGSIIKQDQSAADEWTDDFLALGI